MQTKKAIDRAVEAVGSQRKLAQEVGVTDQALSQWVAQGFVPLKRIKAVALVSGIAVADLLMDFQGVVGEVAQDERGAA